MQHATNCVFTYCMFFAIISLVKLTTTLALLERVVAAASGTCSDASYTMTYGLCKGSVFTFNTCIPDDKSESQFKIEMIDKVALQVNYVYWNVSALDVCKSVDLHETCKLVKKTPRSDYCKADGGFCKMSLANIFATLTCMQGEKTCTPREDITLYHDQFMCCDSNEALVRSMCGVSTVKIDYDLGLYACTHKNCFPIPIPVGEGDSTIIHSSVACVSGALGALGSLALATAAAVMLP